MADSRPPKGPIAPSHEERRGTPRVRSRPLADGAIEPTGDATGATFLGSTVDLSIAGACIRTYEALHVGQTVDLTLHLPEGEIEAQARIEHVRADAIGCTLAGLRFLRIDDPSKTLLDRHLELVRTAARRDTRATDEASAGSLESDWPTDLRVATT